MNYKRREVEKIIDEELIKEFQKQLNSLSEEGKKEVEEQIKELERIFNTLCLKNLIVNICKF